MARVRKFPFFSPVRFIKIFMPFLGLYEIEIYGAFGPVWC